jgi:hypothetical protein
VVLLLLSLLWELVAQCLFFFRVVCAHWMFADAPYARATRIMKHQQWLQCVQRCCCTQNVDFSTPLSHSQRTKRGTSPLRISKGEEECDCVFVGIDRRYSWALVFCLVLSQNSNRLVSTHSMGALVLHRGAHCYALNGAKSKLIVFLHDKKPDTNQKLIMFLFL